MPERRTFESFIPTIQEKLKPLLDAFLKSLGIRREKEEKRRLQQLQPKGRVTTGFLPEMYREVGEQFGLEETGYRAEHERGILDRAMEMFGLSEQWERQQSQLQSTERLAELNRKLTREGWSFQAREKELDRILTKEGWDWQSRENVLNRVFTAEQSALDRALQRSKDGISFDGIINGKIDDTPPPLPTGLSDVAIGLAERGAYVLPKKEVSPVTKKFEAEPSVYRKKHKPTQKTTTYRGTRLGRI